MVNIFDIINSDPDLKDNYLLLNYDSIDRDLDSHVYKILVRPVIRDSLIKKLKNLGFRSIEHPMGKRAGYRMLYQIRSPLLFESEGTYCEIWEQVCCLSYFQKCWLPLDKLINDSIWNDVQRCECFLIPSEVNRLVYNISNSFFTEKSFKNTIREYLGRNKNLLDSEEGRQKLEKEFFAFTPHLIRFIQDEKYDELMMEYKSFIGY